MTRKPGIPNRRAPQAPGQPRDRSASQGSTPKRKRRSRPPQDSQPAAAISAPIPHGRLATWKHRAQEVLLDWRFVTVVGLALTGGLTVISLAFLFKLPSAPNCPAVFWPLAPAALRLHCAQVAANKQTVEDLLEALELVKSLPKDHPLYAEASRLMEQWASDLLNLAEQSFQKGDIQTAIATARKVPQDSSAYKLVEDRIQGWEKTWAEAEAIANKVMDLLHKQNWRQASLEATKLLAIDNSYWQTTKYQEITNLIASTREDISKLAQAQRAIEQGNADDLTKAIDLLSKINNQSLVYQQSQDMLPRLGKRMLELAQSAADRQRFDEALRIANKMPESLKLKQEVDDFITLVSAQSKAARGQQTDLMDAIAQAQQIGASRPIYDRAQQLIRRWQQELGDIAQLDRAKQLAQAGNPEGMRAAIAEAAQIGQNNPRYAEAQRFISDATNQLQSSEDQPILDQAEQLAAAQDANSLQAAIAELRRIAPGRALYKQAQERIRQWNEDLARLQYQPLLDQAVSLADSGDLNGAIQLAQQVPSGTSLHDTAQARINAWQSRIQAEQSLQQAIAQAGNGTPDDLASAIRLAQQVPTSSSLRAQAEQSIEQWSQQILQAAISQADFNIPGAIATAQKIPSGSSAYTQAQLQIALWKKMIGQ